MRTPLICAGAGLLLAATFALVLPGCPPATEPEPEVSPEAAAFEQLKQDSLKPIEVSVRGGVPTFVEVEVPIPANLSDDAVVHALDFVGRYKDLYRLKDPAAQLYLHSARFVGEGNERHLRFGQRHNGIPVYGASLGVHMMDGKVIMTNGHYLPEISAMPAPAVGASQAKGIALQGTPANDTNVLGEPKLTYFDKSVFGMSPAQTHLAWQVCVIGEFLDTAEEGSWLCFVDAHDGSLLACIAQSHEKDWEVWGGPLWLWFDESCDAGEYGYPGAGGDACDDGWDACHFMHMVYDFFAVNWGYHSWDDDDDDVPIHVHSDIDACARYNSFWETITFNDCMVSLDILSHEFTHGLDDHTVDIDGYGEPGAVKEHLSDTMGAMIEIFHYGADYADRWMHGSGSQCCCRDMSNPFPDHYTQRCTPGNDYCNYEDDDGGEHTNRLILDKAVYLLCDGGEHWSGYKTTGLGPEHVRNLYYLIMVNEWPPEACDFIDLRNALDMVATATGQSAWFHCQIKNAFAAVGVFPEGADIDCDGIEDRHDNDLDGDGKPNDVDNCPVAPNPSQFDIDGDGLGDACDDDIDGDGLLNANDNCPSRVNPGQEDYDHDGKGDQCDDDDYDGVLDIHDNCRGLKNPKQEDNDGDGKGDPCDDDDDNDGYLDDEDNCPFVPNDQSDGDEDDVGDDCDNCPTVPNTDQADCDFDGIGGACDDIRDQFLSTFGCRQPVETWVAQFVHPEDIVTVPGCLDCGDWLGPDHRIRVSVRTPADLTVPVHIVDDRGHLVERFAPSAPAGIAGAPRAVSFQPKASFQYRTPGSSEPMFQDTQYFLRIGKAVDVPGPIEIEVLVEHTSAAGG